MSLTTFEVATGAATHTEVFTAPADGTLVVSCAGAGPFAWFKTGPNADTSNNVGVAVTDSHWFPLTVRKGEVFYAYHPTGVNFQGIFTEAKPTEGRPGGFRGKSMSGVNGLLVPDYFVANPEDIVTLGVHSHGLSPVNIVLDWNADPDPDNTLTHIAPQSAGVFTGRFKDFDGHYYVASDLVSSCTVRTWMYRGIVPSYVDIAIPRLDRMN